MVVCTAVPLPGCSELARNLPNGRLVSVRRILCYAVSVLHHQSDSTRRDCDRALFCRRLRSHCREADSRLRGRTHSRGHRRCHRKRDADLFRGHIRSDNEAEPRCSSFELRNFPASLAGLPPVDSAVCGCQQCQPVVSRHRWRRDGGPFLPSYRNSSNGQQLEFVDVNEERVGQPIAGEGSPIVQGNLAAKLTNLGKRYSGIILAEKASSLSTHLLERLVHAQFQETRVYTLESFYETQWRYVPLGIVDPFWPLQTGFQLARISPYHYLKRLFDVVTSATALIVCLPLFILVPLFIWREDGRPVFFRQERVGRDGKRFILFKFRTMRQRLDHADEDIYTRDGDRRITSVGYWLRKLRLDELPQLWNALKGDISLIGPRPEWSKCAERYEQ